MQPKFPKQIKNPVFIYDDNNQSWTEYNSFTFKIPKTLNPKDELFDWNFLEITCDEIDTLERENLYPIHVVHNSDFHYQADFGNFKVKGVWKVEHPESFKTSDYKYVFFSRSDNTIEFVIAFSNDENLQDLMLELFFRSRYQDIGIQAQVVEALQCIFYETLKKIFQMVGQLQNINYESMYDLINQIYQNKYEVELNQQDIYSLVYKTFLTVGLFPIHCELGTMGRSAPRIFLQNLILGIDVVPWSSKFHGSLGIGNIRYSFTDSSQFLLRIMRPKKFRNQTSNQFVNLRIIDFFPLDCWIELASKFFIEHLKEIWNNIQNRFSNLSEYDETIQKKQNLTSNDSESSCQEIKEPLLQKELEMNEKDEVSLEEQLRKNLKKLLKDSLKKIEISKVTYGIEMKLCKMKVIHETIAKQFYENYYEELNRNNALLNLSQIIIETEMKGYSFFQNNCQTPIAAFIYSLSDTFRPFSEVLYDKTQKFKIQNKKVEKIKCEEITSDSRFNFDHLRFYCKYASTIELAMLGQQFIRPAILQHSLDYFGFYSDKLTQEYLDLIRVASFNSDHFSKQSHQHSHKHETVCKHDPEQETKDFEELFNEGKNSATYQYYNIKMNKVIDPVAIYELFKISHGSQLDTQLVFKKFQMHYLLCHYSNEQYRFRKKNIKDAMTKHKIEALMDTIYFFYFNSIRLQIERQQRDNVLTQIGFVIVKNLKEVQPGEPINISLQAQE